MALGEQVYGFFIPTVSLLGVGAGALRAMGDIIKELRIRGFNKLNMKISSFTFIKELIFLSLNGFLCENQNTSDIKEGSWLTIRGVIKMGKYKDSSVGGTTRNDITTQQAQQISPPTIPQCQLPRKLKTRCRIQVMKYARPA